MCGNLQRHVRNYLTFFHYSSWRSSPLSKSLLLKPHHAFSGTRHNALRDDTSCRNNFYSANKAYIYRLQEFRKPERELKWEMRISTYTGIFQSVKVKCTLVQTLRPCIGRMAHRGSRGIALLSHDQRHQKGVRGQFHAPAAFYPRERPGTHCTGG
jgi:hypothetical protein